MYSSTSEGNKLSSLSSAKVCRRFSLEEIQLATKDFDDELVIGQGGFGKVYKGQISNGEVSTIVAIKRLDSMSNQGAPEFRAEIEMLSKLRHCHLVSMIGYCDDNKEMILVYEYMPHGTLHDHLHKADIPLDWVQRLKIAIGAGRGLDYLHTGVGTQHGVIHRDVKSSNILLDENWAAMISDFGLSKIGRTNQPSSYVNASVKGTFGYLDPEYFLTGRLTRKTDVFAFGVVLFELLSGRQAVDIRFGEEQCSLARFAQKCVKERKLDQLVDPNIRGRIFPKCLKQFAKIADRCLHGCVEKRPTMTEVVASLQLLLILQEKSDNSAESSGIMSMMKKFFVSSTEVNSDLSGTNLTKSNEDNMNHCASTKEYGSDHHEMPDRSGEILTEDLKVFAYSELEYATRNFAHQISLGQGGYGAVYKGWVDQITCSPFEVDIGLAIAIKRLHDYVCESPEKAELDLKLLREFSHPNLVKLIGYCLEGEKLFLVYEFMQNGNFKDYLHNGALARLPLATRVKMAVGIARGLVFLHKTQELVPSELPWAAKFGESRFKRHNILLDKDFTAKLSDYDVVKLADGYCAGEYNNPDCNDHPDCYYYPGHRSFHLQSNLSGFRVVLVELLTGKPLPREDDFMNMNHLLHKDEIIYKPKSVASIAKLCFEVCNEVDSELKMLRALEKFVKYIPR